MIRLKSDEEIEILKEGGKILAQILNAAASNVKPGVTTYKLNELAESLISQKGALPSFKNYPMGKGVFYPASLCTSINSVIVHGVPKKDAILKEGDILGLDLGLKWKGLFVDGAMTVGVGIISKNAEKLLEVTKDCLDLAISLLKPGARLGDIGFAVENKAKENGFSAVKDLVGHGVGYNVHEEPKIPNYGIKGEGIEIQSGMVLAIEPMISAGDHKLKFSKDGFGCELADGSLGAHFEHTVAVKEKETIILTI